VHNICYADCPSEHCTVVPPTCPHIICLCFDGIMVTVSPISLFGGGVSKRGWSVLNVMCLREHYIVNDSNRIVAFPIFTHHTCQPWPTNSASRVMLSLHVVGSGFVTTLHTSRLLVKVAASKFMHDVITVRAVTAVGYMVSVIASDSGVLFSVCMYLFRRNSFTLCFCAADLVF
jgi:hypothetical protein